MNPSICRSRHSSLVAALDPRSRSPFDRTASSRRGLREPGGAGRTFAEVDRIETSALLAGIAQLAPNDPLKARARWYLADCRPPSRVAPAPEYQTACRRHLASEGRDRRRGGPSATGEGGHRSGARPLDGRQGQ